MFPVNDKTKESFLLGQCDGQLIKPFSNKTDFYIQNLEEFLAEPLKKYCLTTT